MDIDTLSTLLHSSLYTHSMTLPNSLLPTRTHAIPLLHMPLSLFDTHVTPFPLPLYQVYIISGLSTPHTHTLSHTQTRAETHTDTHKHLSIWILLLRHTPLHILSSSRYVYTPLSLAQMHTKILHLSNSHISPHVRMCISHTHSLIMSMCLHVTQHKTPCTS